MKLKLIAISLLTMLPSAYGATVVQLGSGGVLTNLQTSSGNASSTLVWGLVVDTTGNGFTPGSYLPGVILSDTNTLQAGQLLTTTGGVSDDRLLISTNLFATGGSTDGSTGLSKPTNINFYYAADGALGISPLGGQSLGLMWFDATTKTGQVTTEGTKYGFVNLTTTYGLVTPADQGGGSLAFGQLFLGADPARPASLTLGVPEPSAVLLGALGALGLLRRRRI